MSKRISAYVLSLTLIVLMLVAGVSARDLTELGLQSVGSYDLGGNTVTFISWTAARIENYFDTDPIVMGRIQEAEDLFNCKIEFLQTRDIPSVNFSRLLAGESTYDLWFTQSRIGYFEIVSEGAAYPVEELLSEQYFNGLPSPERETIDLLEFKGNKYGIGKAHFGAGHYFLGPVVLLYNQRILEESGLADPYELYLDDAWDWDTFTAMIEKLTVDTDGDGITDQWGCQQVRTEPLAVSNGSSVTRWDPESGRELFTFTEPAAIEALEQDLFWNQSGYIGGNLINGTAAFDMTSMGGRASELMNPDTGLKDPWGIAPLPKGPQADRYYYPDWSPEVTILPINSAQPEAMVALHAFLFQEDDVPLNLTLARYFSTKEAAEMFIQIQDDYQGETRYLFEMFGGNTVTEAVRSYRNGDKTPAAAMAEIAPMVQAALDDLFF